MNTLNNGKIQWCLTWTHVPQHESEGRMLNERYILFCGIHAFAMILFDRRSKFWGISPVKRSLYEPSAAIKMQRCQHEQPYLGAFMEVIEIDVINELNKLSFDIVSK